jgi:DNA-binding CsgD family transcriptional regulator
MARAGVTTVRLSPAAPAADIVLGVRLAAGGKHVVVSVSPAPPRTKAAAGMGALTRRERDVLAMLGRGHDNAEIADALQISAETVRTHAKRIYRKLGVRSRGELLGMEL